LTTSATRFESAPRRTKERTPGKDEKPEDKEKLDKEFKEQQKKLEEKLAQEKGLAKWTYLVSSWTVDSLLKDRAQLLVDKKEELKQEEPKKEGAASQEPKEADPTRESQKDGE
jgi:hypothetical protein